MYYKILPLDFGAHRTYCSLTGTYKSLVTEENEQKCNYEVS